MFHQLLSQAIGNLGTDHDELGLLSIMPLFDSACSKTWPKSKVGERFRAGVTATEDIITFFMTKGSVFINCTYGKLTMPEIVYKYLRTSVVHEGVMPDNINFIEDNKIIISDSSVSLPKTISHGLLIAAIGFKCYEKERHKSAVSARITIGDQTLQIRDAIGNHEHVRDIIRATGLQTLA